MKNYSVKPNKAQLKVMKQYWAILKQKEENFFQEINILEKELADATRINNIEFFMSEYGYYCGIGSTGRTMDLIHAHELEK